MDQRDARASEELNLNNYDACEIWHRSGDFWIHYKPSGTDYNLAKSNQLPSQCCFQRSAKSTLGSGENITFQDGSIGYQCEYCDWIISY